MIKNYLKTAWRSLARYKVFTLINIAGLSVGISAAVVIYLVVQHDLAFDKFEQDNDRIYRVVSDLHYSDVSYYNSGIPQPVGPTLKAQGTGISAIAPIQIYGYDVRIKIPATGKAAPLELRNQSDIIFADENYFKIIGYKWLAGSAGNSVKYPNKVVLTQKRAAVYFPGVDIQQIVGKQVVYNDSVTTTVSGIVADQTENTDFIFKDFISLATISNSVLKTGYSWGNWGMTNGSCQLFIKLARGTTPSQVTDQLVKINDKHIEKRKGFRSSFVLQPLSDLHFNADYNNFTYKTANRSILYGLLAIGAFLLLLGCINFVNLSTAHASQRAKEIGIRKTLGSSRGQLMAQFLSEAALITIVATVIAVAFVPVALKIFADLISEGVRFDPLGQPHLLVFLVLLVVVVSLLSGWYPALVQSGYKPVLVLKDHGYANTGQTRKVWLRRGLTVFQFLIAQVFVMGTFMVARQISFAANADLGFKKEAIVNFSTPWSQRDDINRRRVLLNEIKRLPGIERTAIGSTAPASGGTSSSQMIYRDGKKEVQTDVQLKTGDTSYLKLYHIKLLAGKNMLQSDTTRELIINETYAHILGFKKATDAVGHTLQWSNLNLPISGVMADFHQQSLRQPIKPLAFSVSAVDAFDIHLALVPQTPKGATWKQTIAQIGRIYKKLYPAEEFDPRFYDETIARFYQQEQHIAILLKWATGLAIAISCMGLLGLVIYTTNTRTKEIGIRKVLGASIANIVTILSSDLIKLVLLSFAIATPIAWWGVHKWLQNYAYHIDINWWVFALSGILMIFIALVTLSFKTITAAMANPVKSLRSE